MPYDTATTSAQALPGNVLDSSPYPTDPILPLRLVAEWNRPSTTLYPSGFSVFDTAMAGGFRGGELNVISGPTSQGKTSWSQQLTANFDAKGLRTIWFTYEMSPFHLQNKFDVILGGKQSNDILAPMNELEGSLEYIREYVKKAVEFGCVAVFIDHLHYLVPLTASANVSLLIGGIVRELKKLAVSQNVCIFLIAHSRKVYADEQLDLNSIRDSSLIAQEATYVYLVERVRKEQLKRGRLDMPTLPTVGDVYGNQTRITLAKNRTTGQSLFQVFDYADGKYTPAEDFDALYTEHRDEILANRPKF